MKNRSAAGYNLLAPLYDRLAVFIVGKAIHEAQTHFLHCLADRKKLLILGGGTGWILEGIQKINSDLKIDFIDQSPKMIELAKVRRIGLEINFIVGTEADIRASDYDCVITNFYLDLFENTQLKSITAIIQSHLQPGTLWLATDFCANTVRQRVTIRFMYFFFRMVTGLTTTMLPSWQQVLIEAGGKKLFWHSWRQGFIAASVFQF